MNWRFPYYRISSTKQPRLFMCDRKIFSGFLHWKPFSRMIIKIDDKIGLKWKVGVEKFYRHFEMRRFRIDIGFVVKRSWQESFIFLRVRLIGFYCRLLFVSLDQNKNVILKFVIIRKTLSRDEVNKSLVPTFFNARAQVPFL